MQQFFGMNMLMSVVKMPKFELYWSRHAYNELVASVMGIKRFKKCRKFLHASDHLKTDKSRLYKIKPVLEAVRKNCLKIEPGKFQSIDEQIISAKTEYSGIRQYNLKKHIKWVFKNFLRAGKIGIIFDFFLLTGAKSAGIEKCTGESVVLRLSEGIPKHNNYYLYFDNWFSILDLMLKLKSIGILATEAFRSNRFGSCQLEKETELNKKDRGSSSYRTDQNSGFHLVKWFDNKCVTLGSLNLSVEVNDTVKRWYKNERIDILSPDIIKGYIETTGGVNLGDMLMYLYRTNSKPKRRYLKVIFHCIDIVKINGWLLYKRHCEQLNISSKKRKPLLSFTCEIA